MKSVSPQLMIQKDMRSTCVSVRFSPDGRLAALVPYLGSINVIDRNGGNLYRPVTPAEHCKDLCWSADGKALYCSRGNAAIELVGLGGEVLQTWNAASRVGCFDVAPDGSRIALSTMDRLQCLNGAGDLLWERNLTEGGILSLGILPSGSVLAVFYGTLIREYDASGVAVMDYSAGGESPLSMTLRENMALLPCQSGLYLLTAGTPEAKRIIDVEGSAQCAAFGPDMKRLALGLMDGSILFAGADGAVEAAVPPETDCIQLLDWSPDGSQVFAGSSDGTIRAISPLGETLWSRPANRIRIEGFACEEEKGLTLFNHREEMFDYFGVKQAIRDFILKRSSLFTLGSITTLDSGPGGTLAMGFDDTVSLWDGNGEKLWETTNLGPTANAVKFNPAGDVIAAGCADGTVRFFGPGGEAISSFSTGNIAVKRIAWGPGGNEIGASYFFEKLHVDLWDREGNLLRRIEGNGGIINDMAFSRDGRIVTAAMNGTVRVWNREGILMEEFIDPDGFSINSVSIEDGGTIMAFTSGGKAIIWRPEGGKKILKPKTGDMLAHSILAGDGDTYLTSYEQNMVNTVAFRTAKGELIFKRTMEGLTADIPLALDKRSGVIFCGVNNMLYRFDRDGNALETVRAGKTRISSFDFLPGGNIAIVAGYADGMIDIIDGDGGVTSAVLDRVQEISAVSIDPRGDRFAAAAGEGTIHIWDGDCRETACFTTGHQVPSLRIAPGGDYIAVGSSEGSMGIWTVQGELVAEKEGEPFDAPVHSVWKGDGSTLMVAYVSGKVRQMDLQCAILTEHNDIFSLQPAVSYDTTGKFLVYVNMDTDLAVRDADSGDLLVLITPFEEGYIVSTPDDYYDVTDESLLARVMFRRYGELVGADHVPGRRIKGLLDKVLSYMR